MPYHLSLSDVTTVTSKTTEMGNKQTGGKPTDCHQQPVTRHTPELIENLEHFQNDLVNDKLTECDADVSHELDNNESGREVRTETDDITTSVGGDLLSAAAESREVPENGSTEAVVPTRFHHEY